MMRPVTNRDEYLQFRDSAKQKNIVDAVRNGDEKSKHRLLQMTYTCMPNEDGSLKGSTQMTTTVGMDVDHIAKEQMQEVKERILAKKDELGLLMLELSARGEGYHLVFKRKAELSQEDNLRLASDLLGVEFDKGAKDITRVFFTTTASEEDLIYLDDELFVNEVAKTCLEGTTSEVSEQGTALQAGAESGGVNPAASSPSSSMQPVTEIVASSHDNQGFENGDNADNDSANALSSAMSPVPDLSYHDIPYSVIIAKYWELFNEGKEPAEGDRNVKTYELAMTLRPICDYDQGMMERVIPRYDGFPKDEWRKTITNALNEPRKSMPYRLKQLLKAVKDERKMALIAPSDSPKGEKGVPERPKRMPELLKLLSAKVPMTLKAMVEEAVWPAMCAHLKGVTFRYIDGVIHEANISSPLIGRQSSGKGAVNQPIECLLADITARDKENESRLLDWRRRNQGKGASKDKQPRPEDIVIQRLDDDLTPAALSQALIDAETNGGKRVITKVDEIELLNRIGNGKNDTVGVLVRYGWDSARWGQRRVGLDSVSGSYTVRWVWNASCTLKSARKFITNTWIADGSLSRLNVPACLLPTEALALPPRGEYDE